MGKEDNLVLHTTPNATREAVSPSSSYHEDRAREVFDNAKHSAPDVIELQNIQTEAAVFVSRPSSHMILELNPQIQLPSVEERKQQRIEELKGFFAASFFMFLEGWNDGTPGPMLPAMQRHYHIGFILVSLIFVANCAGYIVGSLANIHLTSKLGFGKSLVLGALFQVVAYSLQGSTPPFPVFVISYCFSGFGISIQAAQTVVFVMSLKDSATKMGVFLAAYGVGALISPLVGTQFAPLERWGFFFLISLGIALVNVVALTLAFRFKQLDAVLAKSGHVPREKSRSRENHYKQILELKVVHILAFFILAYVGVEVTIGGWIVTFVMEKRGGGSSSGYLTSGFFGGLTLGRIALLWLNRKIGERRVVWLYISLAICLEITIWVVPSLIENAVAVAFVGLFLGPIYPIVMNHTGKLIPQWLVSGAVGWIAGLGQTGSAILPFVTGSMSSKLGVTSLQPL
ncbi:MFS general substrate transporter, partial [Phellopilus nigrolimitatus]